MSTEAVAGIEAPAVEALAPPVAPEASPAPEVSPVAPAWPEWAPALPKNLPESLPLERVPTYDEAVAAIDTPATSPMDYRFPPLHLGRGEGEATAQDLQAIEGVRSILWHGNLPVLDGNALMNVIGEESKRLGEHMSNADFDVHERQSDAALRRVFGERYEPLRAKLEDLFDEIGRQTPAGTIEPLLEANWHVLISPLVMSRLLQHVERLDQRRRS